MIMNDFFILKYLLINKLRQHQKILTDRRIKIRFVLKISKQEERVILRNRLARHRDM